MKRQNNSHSDFRIRECGAALVEFAVLLPFVALLLTETMKVGASFCHQLAATDTARVVARISSEKITVEEICNSAKTAFEQSVASTGLDPSSYELSISTSVGDRGGLGWTSVYLHTSVRLTDAALGSLSFFRPEARTTFPLRKGAGRYGFLVEINDNCDSVWNP